MSDAYSRLVQLLQQTSWWKQELHVSTEDLREVLREVLTSRTRAQAPTELTPDEIHHLTVVRNKIETVKSVRERTGLRLAECLEIVNKYLEEHK